MDRRRWACLITLFLLLVVPQRSAWAFIDLGGDFQSLDPNAPVDPSLLEALVLTIGGATDQRPGIAGGPLSEVGAGVDVGIQVSVVKPSRSYFEQMGSDAGDPGEVILPIPRLMVHKGFGSRVTGGISAMGYIGNLILGADLTWAFIHGEEGPTVAFRWSASHASLTMPSGGSGAVEFKVNTYTPQILISRRLEFADPYLGVGYSFMFGRVSIPIDVAGTTVTLTQDGRARNFISFVGVAFRLGPSGVRLGLEGSYSPSGMHSLGTRIGFQF